jgi:hypothetical protein
VSFVSPKKGVTRTTTIASLAKDLEAVLRPIIERGPRSLSGNDAEQHGGERTEISTIAEARSCVRGRELTLTFVLCPAAYRERRWESTVALESLIRTRQIRDAAIGEVPPDQRGTCDMPWGIYNDAYGEPWAITMAGQFWMRCGVAADYDGPKLSDHDLSIIRERPPGDVLQAGAWVSFNYLVRWIYNVSKFAASLAGSFHDGEQVAWSITGAGLADKWLAFPQGSGMPMGPCVSPTYPRRFVSTATELKSRWREWAVDCSVEICGLFSRDGRRIRAADVDKWFTRFEEGYL